MGEILHFDMGDKEYEKPNADISMATDYDQRYLGIITKIFCKVIDGWKDKTADSLNEHLETGGQIAMYWYKMRLVGAILWKLEGDAWRITGIGFKRKKQNQGFEKELLEYMFWKISEASATPSIVQVASTKENASLFRKHGFTN